MPEQLRVEIALDQKVTAFVYPAAKRNQSDVTLILGHGAGAGQNSDFMTSFAAGIAMRGANAVTFNFLYTEQGLRVPDSNNTLEACYMAVIEAVRRKEIGRGTLVIGGKSLGGRIASQIAAGGANVEGLVFLGYPLHPPASEISFARSICRPSKFRSCLFKARATRSARPANCGRSSIHSRHQPIFTSWKAGTIPSKF